MDHQADQAVHLWRVLRHQQRLREVNRMGEQPLTSPCAATRLVRITRWPWQLDRGPHQHFLPGRAR